MAVMPLIMLTLLFIVALCALPLAARGLTPITTSNINDAADLWVSNEAQARTTYGHIADWNTSQVTSLQNSKFFLSCLRCCRIALLTAHR